MCSAERKPDGAVETRLMDLIDRGYRFIHPCDDDGNVVAVVGIRAHGSVIDVVRLNAEDDVVASRVPGDEENVLAPRKMLWRRRGAVGEVLNDLLALDDQYGADRARPRGGCWVTGRPGQSKWVAAVH
ncbi:hypothetical protein [Amycolatopsis pithecellobii]|uniref:Uncharacterized protein n=1 Tax=Amycolatopsis pithecellobii TaxID=664692 RepID=A0A6N7Z6D5_9PSEU|nr:hypothetical protein [Amycolatopsis pithecellobii]MTD58063.1 hypothetical protein [Amycolatopsis pithecellobii]